MARTDSELTEQELLAIQDISEVTNNKFLYKDGSWSIIWVNGWDLIWPASSTDWVPALFDWITWKLLKNSTPTGTGNPVMQTSPSFVTSIIWSATMAVMNTISTVINAFGAATTLTIGWTPTTAITHTYSGNATATATTKTVNLATWWAVWSTTNVNIWSANGGTTAILNKTIAPLTVPQWFLINGQIVTSVATNNLTVAIKTLNGTDPSATDPVYCRIWNTVRTLTSALSVTTNAWTNWFNSWSTELATQEVDYFVYLTYRTASTNIQLWFSRISYWTLYSDFSGTTTNEKYAAFSTAPASTDQVENIGRFNATLSAWAWYTWSIPAISIIINRPIYETRTLNFTPTLTLINAPTSLTVTARYKIVWWVLSWRWVASGTANWSNAWDTLSLTLPFWNNSEQWVTAFIGNWMITDAATFDDWSTKTKWANSSSLASWQFPSTTRKPTLLSTTRQYFIN